MQLITIESSDEESPNNGTSRRITPRHFEIMSSDDDSGSNSSSSHDSIWVKGISRDEIRRDTTELRVDTDGKCNESNIGRDSLDSIPDETSVRCSSHCEPLGVDTCEAEEISIEDGSSSLSSNDSIWDNVGLWEIREISSEAAKELTVRCTDVNLKNRCSIEVPSPESAVQKAILRDERSLSELISSNENSGFRCTQQSFDSISKQSTENQASGDDSSVSSLESLLQKNYFERKKPLQPNNSDPVSSVLKTKIASARGVPKKAQQSRDDSSTSSSDSILQKTYFERKKLPIHSYYDYCKYYPSSSKQSAIATNVSHAVQDVNYNNSITTTAAAAAAAAAAAELTKSKQQPPQFIQPPNTEWQIILLMDHREFGCSNNFLQQVETEINKHFGRKQCEITTLPSADYLYVARLLSTSPHNAGEILQERVLDMVIERKAVQDVCQCLITDSKKYRPLSFFEAQMYKLMNCGVEKKVFVMEGDENSVMFGRGMMHGAKSRSERDRRLKRVKTLRLQLANGEFKGVELVCTKSRHDTVKFLIYQLKVFQETFDPKHPPLRTRDSLTKYINRQMRAPTFLEYLRLRSIPSIGDVKAMKVIMDPNLGWDKNFISPASSKTSKSTLDDKAAFWKAPSSIQINTYIKAKSNKNSSRRNAEKSQESAMVSTQSSVSRNNSKAFKQSKSKKITSFFDTTASNGDEDD